MLLDQRDALGIGIKNEDIPLYFSSDFPPITGEAVQEVLVIGLRVIQAKCGTPEMVCEVLLVVDPGRIF